MQTTDPGPAAFSWSHSRDLLLQACARRYYYRYYLAQDGWRADAPPERRHAYALTQLLTLDLVLGAAIHARAREIATAIITRRNRPALNELRERTRAELNRVCVRSRTPATFLHDPKQFPILLDVYYGRGTSPSTVERVRAKMERCLSHLATSPVWTELERCHPGEVRVIDQPALFPLDGTPVWAAPDLVFTPPDDRPVIVDWKTGSVDVAAAIAQLSLYAHFVRQALSLPHEPHGYEGRIVELGSGEAWSVDLTVQAIADAQARVRTSTEAMRALLEPPEYARPLPIGHFPLTRSRAGCPRCNYWELCEPAIRSIPTATRE